MERSRLFAPRPASSSLLPKDCTGSEELAPQPSPEVFLHSTSAETSLPLLSNGPTLSVATFSHLPQSRGQVSPRMPLFFPIF